MCSTLNSQTDVQADADALRKAAQARVGERLPGRGELAWRGQGEVVVEAEAILAVLDDWEKLRRQVAEADPERARLTHAVANAAMAHWHAYNALLGVHDDEEDARLFAEADAASDRLFAACEALAQWDRGAAGNGGRDSG